MNFLPFSSAFADDGQLTSFEFEKVHGNVAWLRSTFVFDTFVGEIFEELANAESCVPQLGERPSLIFPRLRTHHREQVVKRDISEQTLF